MLFSCDKDELGGGWEAALPETIWEGWHDREQLARWVHECTAGLAGMGSWCCADFAVLKQ